MSGFSRDEIITFENPLAGSRSPFMSSEHKIMRYEIWGIEKGDLDKAPLLFFRQREIAEQAADNLRDDGVTQVEIREFKVDAPLPL